MFEIGKIVGAILMPPGLFVVLAAISLWAIVAGKKKLTIMFSSSIVVLGTLLSLTPVSDAIIRPLENEYRPFKIVADISGFPIVVLGGGFLRNGPGADGYGSLRPESLTRALYGAQLAAGGKGVLCFTGGTLRSDRRGGTEADAASRLWQSLGIDPSRIRLERRSLDTKGNALFVKQLLGNGPVILVTSAWHMPRAMLAFRKAGIQAIAAPCSYRADSGGYDFTDWLPNANALQTSAWAIHEYVGLAWYSVSSLQGAPASQLTNP